MTANLQPSQRHRARARARRGDAYNRLMNESDVAATGDHRNGPDNPTPPHIPPAIWALGFVSLLMDVSSELIHSLLPVFMFTALGASALTIGLIEGAAEATALIVKVFSGVLSDAWGRRKPLAVLGYGLGALSKPLFAIAQSSGMVLTARLIDRIGKGIRGAPRDALVADIAPPAIRGAAFGLRQSLDTVGAFMGPVLAIMLMLAWANDFRAVFAVAIIPAVLSVGLLFFGVKEPAVHRTAARPPLHWSALTALGPSCWQVIGIGAIFSLARFSEAFLVLRAQQGGLSMTFTPLVLIVINAVYALAAYPFGKLSDRISHRGLLMAGLMVLIAADAALALGDAPAWLWTGVALWGLHMGMTQGLLAAMIADTAPDHLRGTAYGFFNLSSGVALLAASVLAGWLWDGFGSAVTFIAGALLSGVTLVVLLALGQNALPGGRLKNL